jgi:hypothetical protein
MCSINFKHIQPLVPSHHTCSHLSPICTSAKFDCHTTASSPFASTPYYTHLHTPIHFYIHPTIGSSSAHTSSFRSNSLSSHFESLSTPSLPTTVKPFLPHLYTSLCIPEHFCQHPTTCSSSVLITTCLPQFHPLINSTPSTITLGVVTWRLGIALRDSGTSFLAHLSPLQSVYLPGKCYGWTSSSVEDVNGSRKWMSRQECRRCLGLGVRKAWLQHLALRPSKIECLTLEERDALDDGHWR